QLAHLERVVLLLQVQVEEKVVEQLLRSEREAVRVADDEARALEYLRDALRLARLQSRARGQVGDGRAGRHPAHSRLIGRFRQRAQERQRARRAGTAHQGLDLPARLPESARETAEHADRDLAALADQHLEMLLLD